MSLCSLHHFQSELINKEGRVGARGGQTPGRGHPCGRGCLGSSRAAWSSRSSFRRCPGGLSRAAGPTSVPGEGLGRKPAADRRPELGSICPLGNLDLRPGSEGQRCQLETSLSDLDPCLVTNMCNPTRLIAAPRRFPNRPSQIRGSRGSVGCTTPDAAARELLSVLALGGQPAARNSAGAEERAVLPERTGLAPRLS